MAPSSRRDYWRRSMEKVEPGWRFANSFISEAIADASHSDAMARYWFVTTPIENETIGNACRSPRRSVTSMYPCSASAVS